MGAQGRQVTSALDRCQLPSPSTSQALLGQDTTPRVLAPRLAAQHHATLALVYLRNTDSGAKETSLLIPESLATGRLQHHLLLFKLQTVVTNAHAHNTTREPCDKCSRTGGAVTRYQFWLVSRPAVIYKCRRLEGRHLKGAVCQRIETRQSQTTIAPIILVREPTRDPMQTSIGRHHVVRWSVSLQEATLAALFSGWAQMMPQTAASLSNHHQRALAHRRSSALPLWLLNNPFSYPYWCLGKR